MINRKIAMSAMSILTALSLTGATAFAAFTSQATSSNNTFGSGDLVLRINTVAGVNTTPIFSVPSATPGQSFDQKMTLQNTGSVPAATVNVVSIGLGGPNNDLADKLTLNLFNDANDNGIFDGGDTSLGSGHLSDPTWAGFTLPGVALGSGGTYNLGARVTFDADADNTYQGKSVSFSLAFQANQ